MPDAFPSATTKRFNAELYVTVVSQEFAVLFRPVVVEMSVTAGYLEYTFAGSTYVHPFVNVLVPDDFVTTTSPRPDEPAHRHHRP